MEHITISVTVDAKLSDTWKAWTEPEHIVNWNFASEEWCCPSAINEIVPGGRFSWRMEAKDGSIGFDYAGHYIAVEIHNFISKKLDDGRAVTISFNENDANTIVTQSFVPDGNDLELQRLGWQAIMNNFKAYTEAFQFTSS